MNSSRIFMYISKRSGHQLLQRIDKSDAILKKHKITHTDHWARRRTKWWVDSSYAYTQIWEAPQEYKWQSEKGPCKQLHANKNAIQKAQHKRNWWLWWRNWTNTIYQTFPESTMTTCTNNSNLPRQQEHYTIIRKRQYIKLQKDTSNWYMLFFCSKQV